MEQLQHCPVCHESKLEHHLTVIDHSVSKEEYQLNKCQHCGFVFTNPRPTENAIGKYYAFEDYISHTNTNKGFINKAYQIVRNITLNQKLQLINQLAAAKETLTDIGCGTGHFLQHCKDNGWKISGSEPSDDARSIAQKNTGINITKEVYQLNQTSQVVTMWHVLEHVHQLQNTLLHIQQLTTKNGHFILALPNYKSWDAQHYGPQWAAYDVPRHLYHFDKKTITLLIQQYGFKLVKTKPMLFDSIYVSMLSEKYRGTAGATIIGALKGIYSNISGIFTGQYSSHIYIFKKL